MMSDQDRADQLGQATREKLAQFIARIERIEAEQAELSADKTEIYAEVKTFGFDVKVMRKLIALRKLDANDRAEQEALLGMYEEAAENANSAVEVVAPKVDAILLNKDGSRENVKVENLSPSFIHDDKFYAHYKDNAYRQV